MNNNCFWLCGLRVRFDQPQIEFSCFFSVQSYSGAGVAGESLYAMLDSKCPDLQKVHAETIAEAIDTCIGEVRDEIHALREGHMGGTVASNMLMTYAEGAAQLPPQNRPRLDVAAPEAPHVPDGRDGSHPQPQPWPSPATPSPSPSHGPAASHGPGLPWPRFAAASPSACSDPAELECLDC